LTEGDARGHHSQGSGGGASARVPSLQSGGGGNGDKGSSNTIRMAMDLKIFFFEVELTPMGFEDFDF